MPAFCWLGLEQHNQAPAAEHAFPPYTHPRARPPACFACLPARPPQMWLSQQARGAVHSELLQHGQLFSATQAACGLSTQSLDALLQPCPAGRGCIDISLSFVTSCPEDYEGAPPVLFHSPSGGGGSSGAASGGQDLVDCRSLMGSLKLMVANEMGRRIQAFAKKLRRPNVLVVDAPLHISFRVAAGQQGVPGLAAASAKWVRYLWQPDGAAYDAMIESIVNGC